MTVYKLSLLSLLTMLVACNIPPENSAPAQSPNILILLADDLGYGDLGCYGGTAHTPNLDRLAAEGIRMTDFYAAAPNCSPSRVGLLTGRSPSIVGMYNYIPEKHPMHLPAEAVTIAETAKSAAYHTGHFGKWHVSCLPQDPRLNQPQPHEQGFDHSLGTGNNAQPSHLDPTNFVRNGQPLGKLSGYSCDIVVNEAMAWLDTLPDGGTPFLLYAAFHEPHKVVASPPELTAKYAQYPQADAEYFANVENMDRAIGRLLQYLTEKGLDENTLILFASDNGSYRNASNGPLLGGKSFVYEGGIRVPGILRWKGRIRPGQTVSDPAGLVDIMPTLCELTGTSHPAPDQLEGTSLLPLIQGNTLERTKPLSWFFYRTSPEIAMRIGDYTILGRDLDTTRHTHPTSQPDMEYIKNMGIENFELYHISEDIGQQHNLDYKSLDLGPQYRDQLVSRLRTIQEQGRYWDSLPPAKGNMKLKSEWRQLHSEGFSN